MGLRRQEKFLEVLGCGLELPGWNEASVGCQRTGGESLNPGVLLAQQLENGKLMSEGTGSWPL